jgi:predicted dehydrogenase
MLRESITAAGLTLVAIGSPDRSDATGLAAEFQVKRFDDLRSLAEFEETDVLWLAAPDPIAPEVRESLTSLDGQVISSEPPFGSLPEAATEQDSGTPMEFMPLMRCSPGFRAAADVLPQFGPVACLNVFLRSGVGQGTLHARLFDAMDVVNTLCGPAETVNAALAGPLTETPEQLTSLRGHLTVNLRFNANRCACLALSDHAGTWFRGVTVLGERGHLRISDAGFEWIGIDGRLIDRHAEPTLPSYSGLIADEIKRINADHRPVSPPLDHVTLMAHAEAARLSSRTGEDESPGKLVLVMSRP